MLDYETLRIFGAAIFLIVTIIGTLRQRRFSWYLLLAWATLQLAAIIIEALISFDYIDPQQAGAWKIRFALSLVAKVLLLCGLLGLAFPSSKIEEADTAEG